MRFVLFALMIVLLPLRGWMSDAMATSMAVAELAAPSHALHAIKSRAEQVTNTAANGVFNGKTEVLTGHEHARQPSADASAGDSVSVSVSVSGNHRVENAAVTTPDCVGHTGGSEAATSDACGVCAACVACHLSALQPCAVMAQLFSLPSPTPLLARQGFASADTALNQKPPIS